MKPLFLSILAILLFVPLIGQAQQLEYVGSTLWNTANDIKVIGNYAYCAFSNGMEILNISDPTNPVFCSKVYCPGEGKRLAISGDYVFIADGAAGVQIINISDISHPEIIGRFTTPCSANDVFIAGNYAFIAVDSAGFQIVDISDRANPQLILTYALPDIFPYTYRAMTLAADDSIVFIGTSWGYNLYGAILIANIADISNPVLLDSIVTYNGPITAIQVTEDKLFFTSGHDSDPFGYGDFSIYDIADPINPVMLNQIGGDARYHLKIVRNTAYFTDEYSFKIYDISNPQNPIHYGLSPFGLGKTSRFDVYQGYAYLVDNRLFTDNVSLCIVDLSDLYFPVLEKEYITNYPLSFVTASNDLIYAIDAFGNIIPVNIADHSNPVPDSDVTLTMSANKVAISGEYLYAAGDSGLQIYNVNNISTPGMLGSFHSTDWIRGLCISENYAYLASHGQGLQIINIENPSNPIRVRRCVFYADEVYVQGDYAYLIGCGNGFGRFFIMNIENKINATILSQTDIDDRSRAFAIKDGYAYIGGGPNLTILDITDPSSPNSIGNYPIADWVWDIKISGNRLYIAYCYEYNGVGEYGLGVYNLSNPEEPSLESSYNIPGRINSIYLKDDYCYVAGEYSLMIFGINQTGTTDHNNFPSSFSLSRAYPNPFNAQTTINYSLDQAGPVSIAVYNIVGQRVTTLINGIEQAGEHKVVWDAKDVPSGIYFAQLETAEKSESIKMVLLK
ncbi:MAG TPA: hypothetical protein DEO84_00550 [candidate division Zixibacteria bacterium]|nr:hypothetical protein [candidate division Zixibacteria bacterium]HBY99783.1 hypothetical protein [candidate division Zixibacteria bacterium]